MSDRAALRAGGYGEAYYREHAAEGCDYAAYGDFERDYGRHVVDTFGWRGKTVLDVGCACGALLRGLVEAGVFAGYGVDLNEYTIELGRRQWGGVLELSVCDAVNLHLFPDAVFDCVHSHQTAEHWRPSHVRLILAELWRVARPGGMLVLNLDTEEVEQAGARACDGLAHDPTHVCIRSRAWWQRCATDALWKDETERWYAHAEAVTRAMRQTAWDWVVCRKPDSSQTDRRL